jgi:hypothetical protein
MYSYLSAILLAFLVTPVIAQTSISLSPTESFLRGAPGSSVTQEFVVINDGASPYQLNCFFEDVWYEGEKTISGDLGTIKEGQAGYQFQCSPNRVLVPPKYVQKIKVIGLIPKDQVGERFTRFYAQMLPPEELKNSGGNAPRAMIGYSSKIGALLSLTADTSITTPVATNSKASGKSDPKNAIQETPSNTIKISSEILNVKVEQTKKFQIVQFQLQNTGNVHLAGNGTLVITDLTDQLVEKTDVKIPFLFPGQTKSISVNLMDPLKSGSYKALLSVSGTANEAVFVKEFPIEHKSGK